MYGQMYQVAMVIKMAPQRVSHIDVELLHVAGAALWIGSLAHRTDRVKKGLTHDKSKQLN